MTENLLQKLEEKMMLLISEIEEARKAIRLLQSENRELRQDKDKHGQKLAELVSLLEALDGDAVNKEAAHSNLHQGVFGQDNLSNQVV